MSRYFKLNALEIALKENIDIKIKLNKEKQAKNLNNIGTSGLLPKININAAGANKGENGLEFATDDFPSINNVESESSNINSGVEVQYIFLMVLLLFILIRIKN